MPVTLYNKLFTFRVTDEKFEIQEDLLKMMTYKNYFVDLAFLSDNKLTYDFAKQIYVDIRALGKEGMRDKSPIRLFKSPAIIDLSMNQIQDCCHLILTNFVIDLNFYNKRNKLVKFYHNY